MKIKLARGPMANRRVETGDSSVYEYRVQEPLSRPIDFYATYPSQETSFNYRYGSYYKSNVVLKDGTVVFEWMGWRK